MENVIDSYIFDSYRYFYVMFIYFPFIFADGEAVPMVLVGNKADLVNQRKVAKEYAGKYANDVLNCAHVETSAKFNINVGTLFTELLTKALNVVEKKDSAEKSKFRRSFKGLNNSLKIPRRFSMKRHSADGGGRPDPVQKPQTGKCVAL
jgi:GTPase SAR1 family protein